MAVVYTYAKAIMAAEATALSAEATTAGLTALATSLTNLATEITTNNSFGGMTDTEFSGVGILWSNILSTAADTIRARVANTVAGYTNTIQAKIASIDNSLSSISSSTAGINANTSSMNTNIALQTVAITGLKADLDIIAANSTIMKNLAQGTGIHMVGPYDWVGLISTYRILVEQGKILETTGQVDPTALIQAKQNIQAYINKIKDLPTLF